jgi:hypothetical protein
MKYEELLYFWFRTMAHDVGQLVMLVFDVGCCLAI